MTIIEALKISHEVERRYKGFAHIDIFLHKCSLKFCSIIKLAGLRSMDI